MKNISIQSIHSIINQRLNEGRQVRLHVIGKSMQPFIQKGDWVIVEPVAAPEMLKKGDIILFSRGNEFVVHRIIELGDKKIITKGDWTRIEDPPILMCDLIGKVVAVEKPNLKIKLDHSYYKLINLFIYHITKIIKTTIFN